MAANGVVGAGYTLRSAFTWRALTPGTARSASSLAALIALRLPRCRRSSFLRLRADARRCRRAPTDALLLAEPLAGAVREAVRLVARAREEEHRSRVALQRDRVLLPGQVDAIDHRLADHVLLLLRERDDRQTRGGRDRARPRARPRAGPCRRRRRRDPGGPTRSRGSLSSSLASRASSRRLGGGSARSRRGSRQPRAPPAA